MWAKSGIAERGQSFLRWKGKGVVLHSKETLLFVAGKEMDFGRHPDFRKGVQQVREHQKSLILGALFDLSHVKTLALCLPLKAITKHTIPHILQRTRSIRSSQQTAASGLRLWLPNVAAEQAQPDSVIWLSHNPSACFCLQYSEKKLFISFQKDGRKNTNRSSNGDKNDCTTYAVLRHQTQPEPEDVTYVNVQPSPKVLFHLEEPSGNSAFSGPVEYATVFFRATAPHSGTEKEKNRST